ncbi:BppU family phage baseplate upper protein [Bacillus mycoides]|uniref:BppU family phage baseplate upper protein n=1 Tax=Bacillus mycoides TaxID=1405 RepID=UPI003D64997D
MEQLTTPYDLYVDLTEGTILVYVNGVPGTKIIQFYQNEGKTSVLNIHIRQQNDVLKLRNKTVRISFKKPDDEIVWQPCEIVDANIGKVTVALEEQTLVVPGDLAVQLQVSDADGRISESDVFYIRVHKSLMTGETIKSTSSLPLLENAVKAGELFTGYKVSDLAAIKPTADAAKKAVDDTKKIVDANSGRITVLEKDMSKQDIKAQSLIHGPNIVNATVASPLNVEVQGRTLVNLLGQTTLDPTKYYLFMPNKGTTKITAGGSSYDGVAKFTGQSAISYTIKQDYRGKVAGSTVENGHIVKRTWSHSTLTTLAKPTETSSSMGEVEQQRYADYISLDGKYSPTSVNFDGGIAQEMHSFDVIRALQDKFGIQIWQGKTALADKVAIAKQLIVDYAAVLYANGSSPQGNKLYVKRWIPSTSTWFGSTTTTESNFTKVQTGSTNVQEIDSNGFIHVIAYADASDGTKPSVVNIDYAMLELKVKADVPMLEDALYEVDHATYNKINIDPDFTGQKLMDKFPYVEGVQHLNPILIAEGANLAPNLTEWTHPTNSKLIETDTIEIYSTGPYQQSLTNIPALPNMEYAYTVEEISGNGAFIGVNFIDDKGAFITQINADTNMKEFKFTTPSTCKVIQIKCSGRATGENTLRFRKPMLNIGSTPKPFVPRNPSYLYTNAVFAGMNSVNDVLYKEDGQWKVLRKWERDVVLDGSIGWRSGDNYNSGYKRVLWDSGYKSFDKTNLTIKWDGKILKNLDTNNSEGDRSTINPNGAVYVSIFNVESGWGNNYTPTQVEIQAYFNGWKVKTADANGKPTAWVSLVDDQDAPTQTLAYVRANRAAGYTPYKLTYQLVTPKIEIVQVEGDLVVDELTQVIVDSGVVVREKANPKQFNKEYYINRGDNNATFLPTRLKNRALRVLKVFKNGVEETRVNRYADKTSPSYGEECISIPEAIYDPSAEYTVTYLVLDKHQFTTNTTDVKVSYNQSVRSTTDALTVGQSDNTTSISILQNIMTDVLARLKANSL